MLKKFTHRARRLLALVARTAGRRVAVGRESYKATGLRVQANRIDFDADGEAFLTSVFAAALAAKPGAFVDVGANLGQTLLKVLALDPAREYVGFEPQLDCCVQIEEFLRENDLSERHRVLPVALSNQSGVVRLLKRHPQRDPGATMVDGFRPDDFYSAEQSIVTVEGDAVLSGCGLEAISTIKIDVEGGELDVVEGLTATLSAHRPFVVFEVLHDFLVLTGQHLDAATIEFRRRRLRALESLLRDHGYSILSVKPNGALRTVPSIEPDVAVDLRLTNYLAVHHDLDAAFAEACRGSLTFVDDAPTDASG